LQNCFDVETPKTRHTHNLNYNEENAVIEGNSPNEVFSDDVDPT